MGVSPKGNYCQGTYVFATEHLMDNINEKRIFSIQKLLLN